MEIMPVIERAKCKYQRWVFNNLKPCRYKKGNINNKAKKLRKKTTCASEAVPLVNLTKAPIPAKQASANNNNKAPLTNGGTAELQIYKAITSITELRYIRHY